MAAGGVTSYAALAQANEPQLRHMLHEADMVPPGNVASWPMQATYAEKGDWQGLMKYNAQAAKSRPAPSAPRRPPRSQPMTSPRSAASGRGSRRS